MAYYDVKVPPDITDGWSQYLYQATAWQMVCILQDTRNAAIDFSVGTTVAKHQYLKDVGQAILEGRIELGFKDDLPGAAEYEPATDMVIVLGSTRLNDDVYARCTVIHEAVHASSDLRCNKKMSVNQLNDEIAGYVAAAIYLRNHGYPMSEAAKSGAAGTFYEDYTTKFADTNAQRLWVYAFMLADKVIAKPGIDLPRDEMDLYYSLWKQIPKTPPYDESIASNLVKYDGVRVKPRTKKLKKEPDFRFTPYAVK